MSDSESSSSALKDSKNIIVDHEVNLRNVLENEQRQCIYHLNSFNDGDDFIPDDRSTPVHRSGEASSSQLPVDNVEVLEEHISKMKQLANTEDSPVKPGVDGRNVKSFEELLELSIKNDSLAVASVNSPTKKQVVKRPFLKKGAGIEARFKPKKLMKRSCQKEKTSIESNVGGHANAQTCSKPMNTKIVNVLPRTNTSAPVAKKSTSVIGNPLSFKKPIALHQTKGSNAPDTSLDNLERLLLSVKIKKEELWCQPCSSPSSSEDGSCWEDEEDIDTSEEPKNQSKKKVRWNDCQPHMSKAKVGVYSKSVQNYMASLEEKLFELQERCASKVEKKVKQKPKSAEISVEIANEIADLRSQIAVIADGIKTLQLYTSNLRANDEAKKRSLDSLGKVRITRELPIREPVKGIPKVPSPCHGEDTTVQFGNGDRMQVLNDGTVIYTFSDGTLQTTFPDGSKVVQFKNGQIERTLVNGLRHIKYPNKCQRTIEPDGSEEQIMADGTMIRIAVDGTEIVMLPNGEREIRSKQYSRREYTNGSVKTIYADGTQETRFSSGRLRIKDKYDKILVDSVVRPVTNL